MIEAQELGEDREEGERAAADEQDGAAPGEQPAPPAAIQFPFLDVRTGHPAAPSLRPE
jgi:hypothetical protein